MVAKTPDIVPNPRDDLLVTSSSFRDCQRTVYSGRLCFGQPADVGIALSRMDWGGALFLPDSHAYRADKTVDAVVSADFWIQAMHEYMFVPSATAGFAGDLSQPGIVWVQLGLDVQGSSGSILGCRVTVWAVSGTIANRTEDGW